MTISVAVLGACGLLGQHLIRRVLDHPQLKLAIVADRRGQPGTAYGNCVDWRLDPALLQQMAHLPLHGERDAFHADIVLSVLPDEGSAAIERLQAGHGNKVVTHAEELRLAADVPLVIPGVNDKALTEMATRLFATPNCTTVMAALPLAALHRAFGVEHAVITTMQATSGADLPGLHWSDIHDTVIANLASEALALENELARLFEGAFRVSASANRVPVSVGHTITMSAKLAGSPALSQIKACLTAFAPGAERVSQPIALEVTDLARRPTQQKDAYKNGGMTLTIGAIRACPVNTVQLTIVGNNLEAGTTGVLIQCAELMTALVPTAA